MLIKVMGDLIKLYGSKESGAKLEPVASCPKCENQEFYICLDGVGLSWEHIYAFECSKCGNKIWIKIQMET